MLQLVFGSVGTYDFECCGCRHCRAASGKANAGRHDARDARRGSARAVMDAGLERDAIDGLLVGPQVGETPQHVAATVAEYLGLQLVE